MRLDRFLKVSRLIKRRTLAKALCDNGRVQVNGRVAKAGTVLSLGDALTIDYGRRLLQVRVMALSENARADEASTLYAVIDERLRDLPTDLGGGLD